MPTWAYVVAVPLALLAALFILQFIMVAKMRKRKGTAAPTSLPGKMGRAVRSEGRALFYFHSPRCGACKAMTPVAEKLAKKHGRVFSVDITTDMTVAREFGVMGTPATVVVEQGTLVEFLIGPLPTPRLEELAAECA